MKGAAVLKHMMHPVTFLEFTVQQLQGWANFPLTKTEQGSEGRSHAGNCSTFPNFAIFSQSL